MDALNEILQLGGYLAENPYAGVGVAAAVAGIVVAAKLASREDPDGPMVRRRRVGGVAMARHLNGAYRKRSRRRRGSTAHAFPALGKEYAGEFAAVFGGPGVGKTMRVVVPLLARRILEGRLSTVVLDTKGEVFDATLRLCGLPAGRPLIHLYSTLRRHPDELVSAVDPFAEPASRANFLEAILPEPPGSDPTWNQRARTMIRAVCQALERTGRAADLPATYDVLKNPRALDELARRDSGAAGVWAGQDNRTHESVRTTALAPLEGLEDPCIRRVFDACRVAPADIPGPSFGQRVVVYLCVGPDDAGRAGPLYAGLIDYLQRRAAYRESGPAVNFLVEEAASYFTIEKLDEYINLGRGFGVNVLLVLQSYDQLKNRLGQHAAASIVGAMDLLMFGRTRSAATAHLLEELSGTVRVTRDAPRATPAFFEYLMGNGRVQERRRVEEERPRIRAQHLYTLPDGHLFVVGSPDLLELVNARTALWPRYAAKVVPRDFDYAELRFAFPSQRLEPEGRPRRAANAGLSEGWSRGSSEPEDGAPCPACSSLNPAGAPECEVCGEPLR